MSLLLQRTQDGKPEIDFETDVTDFRLPMIHIEEIKKGQSRSGSMPHEQNIPEIQCSLRVRTHRAEFLWTFLLYILPKSHFERVEKWFSWARSAPRPTSASCTWSQGHRLFWGERRLCQDCSRRGWITSSMMSINLNLVYPCIWKVIQHQYVCGCESARHKQIISGQFFLSYFLTQRTY